MTLFLFQLLITCSLFQHWPYLHINKQRYFDFNQQVAPQAAKTLSPQFPSMGGFGGGSSNSFGQMPTGAAPTSTSGANYSQMNPRASLNTNGYGRLCGCKFESEYLCWTGTSSHLSDLFQMALSLQHSSPLEQWRQCGHSGKASSTRRITQSSILMLRATSKTCSLWVIQASSLTRTSFFSCLSLYLQ